MSIKYLRYVPFVLFGLFLLSVLLNHKRVEQKEAHTTGISGKINASTEALSTTQSESFSTSASSSPTRPSKSQLNLAKQLHAAFIKQDTAQVLLLLENLNEENIQEVLTIFHNLPAGQVYQKEFETLFYQWGIFSPKSAIEYGIARLNALQHQWWAAYPEAMRAWFSQDASAAISYLDNLEAQQSDVQRLAATLAESYTPRDPQGAMDWAISSSNEHLKTAAMITVADILSLEADTDLATQVFHWLSAEPHDPITAQAAGTWAMNHIFHGQDQTLDLIMQLPSGPVREKALHHAFRSWAPYDSEKAAAWINNRSNQGELDFAIAGLVEGTYRGYASQSLEWAESIQDPALRKPLIQKVITRWHYRDPQAANLWLEDAGFEKSFMEDLISQKAPNNTTNRNLSIK